MLRLLLMVPFLFVSCGSVFQGPVVGSIELEQPADAVDAVVFLRCRGAGLHGDITTDSEHTRVRADGGFTFLGSLTFPTTEHCYVYVRHPRYRTVRVDLDDTLVQKLEPIALTSWDNLFKAGPDEELRRGSIYPWPQAEVYNHLSDTLLWLGSFPPGQQNEMSRYIPAIHGIYRQAYYALSPQNTGLRGMLRLIGMLEERTAYAYPFNEYLQAIKSGDADKVESFIAGGVLRETRHRGSSSSLSIAAAQGHIEVIDVLLAHDEPLHIAGCGSPVLAAIRENQWPAALKLIGVGADTEIRCQERRPVGDLMTGFARRENLDLLRDFLRAGVAVDQLNSRDTTALAEAATDGKIQSVKVLLAAGANPDVRNEAGVKLIDDAASRGYLDVERELRLAIGARQAAPEPPDPIGDTISLPWRRGTPSSYRVYGSYGHIHDMVADPEEPGILWLATGGGLLRIDPESGKQRVWTRVNGLPASAVQDLWFDTVGGFLWLATGAGLARLPLDEMERVETVGSGEPRPGFASGFLHGQPPGTVWYWGNGGLYRLDVENSEALRLALELDPFSVVSIPGGGDFFVSDDSAVWRFDSLTGKREQVISAKELAAWVEVGPKGTPQPRSLALDAGGGILWIGSHAHGVFSIDLDSASIRRPSLTAGQIAKCARTTATPHMQGEIFLAGGDTYAQLERCFGRIADNRFNELGDRIDAGPITDARGDVWWLADDHFHRVDSNGQSTRIARIPDPIGNTRVNAILRVGKRLFVGVDDAPLAILDLEQRTWSSIPHVSNVQRLRGVAANDNVLALGQARYYWVDPQTLEASELTIGPASNGSSPATHWRDLRDLEFDGDIIWALRDNRQRRAGKSRVGLYRVSRDGYQYYDSASGYHLGELATVVQDPSDPARLWLLQNSKNGLIDFDKDTNSSALIGANAGNRRQSEILATAMSDPRLKALTIPPHETLDPDAPDLIWGVRGNGVYVRRGTTVIHRWPASLPGGRIELVRDTATTVWIASSEGLIEFPIEESLDELQKTSSGQGQQRRPR